MVPGPVLTGRVLSVNLGVSRESRWTRPGVTGIDKRPVDGPVAVSAPTVAGGVGLAGDRICDVAFHGGTDKAVYAFAREELEHWAAELGRELPSGVFGENLTTAGLDVDGAVIGERWRIGADVVLEVTAPRIPCRTFAGWIGEAQWVRRFAAHGRPGAYLRVASPGPVEAGDPVAVEHRPAGAPTVAEAFRTVMPRA